MNANQNDEEEIILDFMHQEGDNDKPKEARAIPSLNIFQKYLTLWVILAMGTGILLGYYIPIIPETLERATVAEVSIPIALLLWGMILPMMVQIEFKSVINCFKHPKPVLLTCVVNYAIQPFTMYALALLFFQVIFVEFLGQQKADEYLIGSVLLGSAPCTAMVLVWSLLMNGDTAYTVTQVAVNDLILLLAYVPTVKLLAGASNISIPWSTLLISVGFFVLVPLLLGIIIRFSMSKNERLSFWLYKRILPMMDKCSMVFLVLMVILIFVSQASTVVGNIVDIFVISIPLIIQTILIWAITYFAAYWMKLPYKVAGPATLIACSNFFEMAVAVAISLYGSASGPALATVVGVLIEVPIMLTLVWVNNRTQHLFPEN